MLLLSVARFCILCYVPKLCTYSHISLHQADLDESQKYSKSWLCTWLEASGKDDYSDVCTCRCVTVRDHVCVCSCIIFIILHTRLALPTSVILLRSTCVTSPTSETFLFVACIVELSTHLCTYCQLHDTSHITYQKPPSLLLILICSQPVFWGLVKQVFESVGVQSVLATSCISGPSLVS